MTEEEPTSALAPVVRTAATYLMATYGLVYFAALALIGGGLTGRGDLPRELFAFLKKRKPGDPPSPMERVMGFALGEDGLMARNRAARDREALALAQRAEGDLRLADVMALFGHDRRTAERELTRIALAHGAKAGANGSFHFPRTPGAVGPAPRALGERLRIAENARNDGWVIGVNAFNLASAAFLGTFGLDAIGLGHVAVKTLLAWIPLGLSALLFAVPIWRRLLRAPRSAERRRRHLRALLLDHVGVRALPYHFPGDEAEVAQAGFGPTEVQAELDSLAAALGAGVATIEHDVIRYTFPQPPR